MNLLTMNRLNTRYSMEYDKAKEEIIRILKEDMFIDPTIIDSYSSGKFCNDEYVILESGTLDNWLPQEDISTEVPMCAHALDKSVNLLNLNDIRYGLYACALHLLHENYRHIKDKTQPLENFDTFLQNDMIRYKQEIDSEQSIQQKIDSYAKMNINDRLAILEHMPESQIRSALWNISVKADRQEQKTRKSNTIAAPKLEQEIIEHTAEKPPVQNIPLIPRQDQGGPSHQHSGEKQQEEEQEHEIIEPMQQEEEQEREIIDEPMQQEEEQEHEIIDEPLQQDREIIAEHPQQEKEHEITEPMQQEEEIIFDAPKPQQQEEEQAKQSHKPKEKKEFSALKNYQNALKKSPVTSQNTNVAQSSTTMAPVNTPSEIKQGNNNNLTTTNEKKKSNSQQLNNNTEPKINSQQNEPELLKKMRNGFRETKIKDNWITK